jgi:hypothetical protein
MATQDDAFTATGTGTTAPTADRSDSASSPGAVSRLVARSAAVYAASRGSPSTGSASTARLGTRWFRRSSPRESAFSAPVTSGMASLGGRQGGKASWAWRRTAPPL